MSTRGTAAPERPIDPQTTRGQRAGGIGRSYLGDERCRACGHVPQALDPQRPPVRGSPSLSAQGPRHLAGLDLGGGAGAGARLRGRALPARDRKSTRLNSSHLGISYAVFCLKKKKKTEEQE